MTGAISILPCAFHLVIAGVLYRLAEPFHYHVPLAQGGTFPVFRTVVSIPVVKLMIATVVAQLNQDLIHLFACVVHLVLKRKVIVRGPNRFVAL